MSLSRQSIGAGAVAAAALSLFFIALVPNMPASAQGGLICDVGPADYRRCCKESYRRNPELGVRARAEDIEACLKGGAREAPAAEQNREGDRERAADKAPPEPAAPPQNPPVVLRGTGASPIRRITCASESCEKGCGADEMAISAFCNIGSFPTPTPDGAVSCVTIESKTELPIVLFCAKR
ncbi:MAG: hypothetical protein R3D62_04180 [Xanthobacteraceae bacterium]